MKNVYRLLRAGAEGRRRIAACAAVAAALGCGGCSLSLPASPLGFEADTTGSIPAIPASPLGHELGAEDWRRAKSALAVALDPVGSGAAVAWDNPETGLKGTFVPVGSAFVKNEEICRAFVATVAGGSLQKSLQATGCRLSGAEWAIRDLKPWRRPA